MLRSVVRYGVGLGLDLSCHVMSCDVVPCHSLSRHATPRHATPCCVVSCRVVSCYFMSCHVVSYHFMSCHVMSLHIVSCYRELPQLYNSKSNKLHRTSQLRIYTASELLWHSGHVCSLPEKYYVGDWSMCWMFYQLPINTQA